MDRKKVTIYSNNEKKNDFMRCICIACLCGCAVKAPAESTASAEAVQKACRTIDYYDYSSPVPAGTTADDSYFLDTFFGGDSRMGSLKLYSDLSDRGAEIYYAQSLRLWAIDKTEIETGDGTDTLYNLVMNTTKKNVYLLIGINEIRSPDFADWGAYYDEIITDLLTQKPDTNVYLMMSYYPQELSDIDDSSLISTCR
jgi:hypothetical protein